MSELLQPSRRTFLRLGLAALAAPAIVRASSLMQIKVFFEPKLQQFVITGVSSNEVLSIDMINREAVRLWQESNIFLNSMNFGLPRLRVGDIITISGVNEE